MADDPGTPNDLSDYAPADFKPDGRTLAQFLVKVSSEAGSLRIAKRDRPWQDGAKLDAVGANADDFVLSMIFHNDLTEAGIDDSVPMWPDGVDAMTKQFHFGETGTLNLPWKRGIRCKAVSWRRVESADDTIRGALVDVTFTTDTEDSIDREAFQAVSVRATANAAVEEATFDLDSTNMFDGSIEDITGFAADLVGLLNSPNELLGSVLQAANRLRRAVLFLKNGMETALPGRDGMNDPDGASGRAKLFELLELAAQAQAEALAAQPPTRDVKYQQPVDIWSVAAELNQSSRTLVELNDRIPDLSYIEPGTPIKVLA